VTQSPVLHWSLSTALLPLLAYAALYAWRFRHARREAGGRGAGAAQAAAFAAALVLIAVAVASPLDGLGEEYLFSAHMVQHLLLGDLAPLLVLLSLSRVIMRPATRRLVRVERALGSLAHPAVALLVGLALIYLWHLPVLYQAALGSPLLHALEHATFFTAGLAIWWPLVQPVPMRRGLTGLENLAYVGAAKAGLAALGLFLTWSSILAYPHYATVPRIWGLSAIEDQNVGGAIMMVEQSTVLVIAFAFLFVRMLARSEEEERRREQLEDAATAA
jgi:cytochrome c oxidase assembly factor CtaG